MSERTQVESDKLFWVEMAGVVDAEDSYNLDIFPLPLPPIIQARTRPRRVHGEEPTKSAERGKDIREKANKNGTDEKAAKPITSDHQASGTHGILAWMCREKRR